MLRDRIKLTLTEAMKARDEKRVATLRMAQAAIKNKDIELRTGAAPDPGSPAEDAMIIDVLSKMVKQRRESVDMFEKGGRQELAEAEKAEIAILEGFLPQLMCDTEAQTAITALVAELGVTSPKDMGKVMAAIKERFAGQIDMSKAGPMVKNALG